VIEGKGKGMIQVKRVPDDGTIQIIAMLPNTKDSYLAIVLVEQVGQFVTWMVNTNNWDYFWGHYFPFKPEDYSKRRYEAYRDFMERLEEKVVAGERTA